MTGRSLASIQLSRNLRGRLISLDLGSNQLSRDAVESLAVSDDLFLRELVLADNALSCIPNLGKTAKTLL